VQYQYPGGEEAVTESRSFIVSETGECDGSEENVETPRENVDVAVFYVHVATCGLPCCRTTGTSVVVMRKIPDVAVSDFLIKITDSAASGAQDGPRPLVH
jgi:hypothetical protein